MQVLLAPVLPAEGWFSADLYLQDVLRSLEPFRGLLSTQIVLPSRSPNLGVIGKQFVRQIVYPMLLSSAVRRCKGRSVVHVIDHSYGHLCSGNVAGVVTCHELSGYALRATSRSRFWLWKWRLDGIKKARVLVAITAHAARELQELVGISGERIVVNPCGVDGLFRPVSAREREGIRSRLFGERAAEELYLLHVGSNYTRKNIETLVRAIAVLKQQGMPVRLVKVGPRLEGEHDLLSRQLGVADDTLNLGFVQPSDLVAVYNACDTFLFPSLYEGSGRSVLEAQASGLPCVLANTTSLPEMGGGGALYHEATDCEELADAVKRLVNDSTLRTSIIEKGIQNASQYTWARHGAGLKKAYEMALS